MPDFYKNIIVLNVVESTNNYARQLIVNGGREGTVVLAHYQEKGRGQQGNTWESENGQNLLASLILYPTFVEAGHQFRLSKIISLALVDFLKNEVENVRIKWPNDIYVGDKKIAGILIENSIKGKNLDSAIVGMGLNLNQIKFYSGAPNPVSLMQITGKNFQIELVLNELLDKIWEWYLKLKRGLNFEIDSDYFSHLYRNNGFHVFQVKEQKFEAEIVGIGNFGQLQLKLKTGEVREFMFKEVEFVI